MITPSYGTRTRTASAAVATIATLAIWAGGLSSASAAIQDEYDELTAGGMTGCAAIEVLVERNPRATYEIADVATRAGMPQRDSIDCAANKYAELLAAGAVGEQAAATDSATGETKAAADATSAAAATPLQQRFSELTDGGMTGCAAIGAMVESDPAALYEIAEAGAAAGMPERDAVDCAVSRHNELAVAGAVPQYTSASGDTATSGGMYERFNELTSGGMSGCTAIQVMVESEPRAVYDIADAGVRSGMARDDAINCAANKYADLLAVGGIPQATSAGPGPDTPTGGQVAEAPTTAPTTDPVNTLGDSPQAPNLGDSPIEKEFQFLVDITRASGYDEGTIGCPAIELMVRNNPTQIDEIVDVAARAGIPEDDSIECAARELAAIGPTAPAGPPIPGDPPGFTPDPPLGEPKIIRPPDPPTGPPNAASPT